MLNKDLANLRGIRESCQKIENYSSPFVSFEEMYADELSFDAILMNFIIIGESVSRLSENLTIENHTIPWAKIKSFRNIVAHNYFGVDPEEVWQIIKNELPPFYQNISLLLEKE
jgi:uncharacterized protein with HEPN domain